MAVSEERVTKNHCGQLCQRPRTTMLSWKKPPASTDATTSVIGSGSRSLAASPAGGSGGRAALKHMSKQPLSMSLFAVRLALSSRPCCASGPQSAMSANNGAATTLHQMAPDFRRCNCCDEEDTAVAAVHPLHGLHC